MFCFKHLFEVKLAFSSVFIQVEVPLVRKLQVFFVGVWKGCNVVEVKRKRYVILGNILIIDGYIEIVLVLLVP